MPKLRAEWCHFNILLSTYIWAAASPLLARLINAQVSVACVAAGRTLACFTTYLLQLTHSHSLSLDLDDHSRRRGQLSPSRPSMSVLGQSHGFYVAQPGPFGDVVFPSSSTTYLTDSCLPCRLRAASNDREDDKKRNVGEDEDVNSSDHPLKEPIDPNVNTM